MIHSIHGLKEEDPRIIESLFALGKAIEKNEPSLANNFSPTNYENNPSSLFYLLDIEQRFARGRGEFFVHLEGDRITCMHGLYFNTEVNKLILLARLYKAPGTRDTLTANFLEIEMRKAKELGYKGALITVNSTNKKLIEKFKVFLNRKNVSFAQYRGIIKFVDQEIFDIVIN